MLGLKSLAGLARSRSAPQEIETTDEESEVETEHPGGKPANASASSASVDDALAMVEEDIDRTANAIAGATGVVRLKVANKIALLGGIRDAAQTLSDRSADADQGSVKLVEALDALATTSHEIGERVTESSALATEAEGRADTATAGIAELRSAIEQIASVVNLISDIAKQTNLLALNATIEAARAGEAGRGFAVVANEVKTLSTETQKATDEIAARIEALQSSAEKSIGAVDGVVGEIGRIRPIFSALAAAVEEQVSTTAEISESAHETAGFVRDVADRVESIRSGAESACSVGTETEAATAAMDALADTMGGRLIMMLRQTEIADRRQSDRLPVEITGQARHAGRSYPVKTVDLSDGGLLFKTDEKPALVVGSALTLELKGLGTVPVRVVGCSDLGFHCAFDNIDSAVRAAVANRLDAIRKENRIYIERAQEAAARIGEKFEQGLQSGTVREADLFDTHYRPIEGSNPAQFETGALTFYESVLPNIQEPLLQSDSTMAFCAANDRNGYLPVHNAIYSKPQRPDDPVWNAANCRNRRVFDDRAGLSAARNRRPFLVQAYPRDMGGGNVVWMKEVDAPIVVGGRHWGGFRTAYRM